MQTDQTTPDLFATEDYHVRATTGQRFANYLIDVVVFYVLMIGFGFLMAVLSPATFDNMTAEDSGFGLLDRLVSLIAYALYMSIVEAVFKGKSLGKLITGTRAVNLDCTPISAGTAFARGFSRAVPFCVFSAFGSPSNPWQDRWTDTMVIDERKSVVNQA